MSHFNDSAATWDTPQKIQMMKTLAKAAIQSLQPLLSSNDKLDIIDFGCGTGLFGLEFADFARTITGIDTSEGMLAVFEEKTNGEDHIQGLLLDLEQTDALKSVPANLRADLILSAMAFHHLKQPDLVLGRLASLLAPGGAVAIVDLDEEDGTFHPDNEGMGVKHFGFAKAAVEQWAYSQNLKLQHQIIYDLAKSDRTYPIFLAVVTQH
ncbi:MAG: class I SAM-dependent methyltransferase [Deltaproteobacteria bacterium]|nr:class I SAM-dependent methyltransferase [Deltaproteobacteria bacterium]